MADSKSFALAYNMKRKKKMASGGTVSSGDKTMNYGNGGTVAFGKADKKDTSKERGVHTARLPVSEPGESGAGYGVQAGDKKRAKEDHETALSTLKSMSGPISGKSGFAEGGSVDPMQEITCPHCTKSFSHGGQVANQDKPLADGMKAEYDYLHLSDGLSDDSTGSNEGDEIGDSEEDKLRHDLVSRAMLKRKARK